MRVPEQQRYPARPDERRCQEDVDRDHVRDHCVRRQRARQLSLEPPRTAGPRRRSERSHLDICGELVRAGRLGQDDELVHADRECANLRDRCRERRMVRIDALCEKDQPPH